MYDQREKSQRDYQWALEGARQEGREEGRELGRKEGLMETIQLLQQLLGEDSWPTTDLQQRPLDELSALRANLQQRLRNRENR